MKQDASTGASEVTGKSKQSPRSAYPAFSARFFKRSAVATVVTILLIALTVTVYWSPVWALRYMVFGFWALVFFSLTPLIFKAFLTDGRRFRGLALIGLKLVWTALVFVACVVWPLAAGNEMVEGSAILAGVITPLFVVSLRAIGVMTEHKGNRPGKSPKSNSATHTTTESKV